MTDGVRHLVNAWVCLPGHNAVGFVLELSYRPDDPLAVRLTFPPALSDGAGSVTWIFSRELLTDGLRRPSGDGDVHVRPDEPSSVMIRLRSVQTTSCVRIASADVIGFLTRAYQAVPSAEEADHLDLDALISSLLTHG